MKLHYKILGEGEPLIILHGLFGMLDNWQTLGRRWAEKYQIILVDLRNHGHSPHSETFNYQVMTEDLEELVDDLFLDEIRIIGHSMGGKLAMKFAQTHPDLIKKLVVADIGPKKYPVHHNTILTGLNSVPLDQVFSRKEADAFLAKHIQTNSIRQFFLKNLYWKEKGKLDWRFNLPAITSNIGNVGDEFLRIPLAKPTLFIRGGASDYILDADMGTIHAVFTHARLETIPNAGHWLHAENPSMFYEIVDTFLSE